ncbi:hypothetical protein ACWKSP_34535 [Micromonosporaceae bacterium Da 78-11]
MTARAGVTGEMAHAAPVTATLALCRMTASPNHRPCRDRPNYDRPSLTGAP